MEYDHIHEGVDPDDAFESDYELLRDAVVAAFNPPDDDAAEVSILINAVAGAAEKYGKLENKYLALHSRAMALHNALAYMYQQCAASGHIDTEPHMARARDLMANKLLAPEP